VNEIFDSLPVPLPKAKIHPKTPLIKQKV